MNLLIGVLQFGNIKDRIMFCKFVMFVVLMIFVVVMVFVYGDMVFCVVDMIGLFDLFEEMVIENLWCGVEGDLLFKVVEIGGKGFNSNCVCCYGFEVILGGLVFDLCYLEVNEFGDEWYLDCVLYGYEQNGVVKMLLFQDIFSQEVVWVICIYIEMCFDVDEMVECNSDIIVLCDWVKVLFVIVSVEEVEVVVVDLDKIGDEFEMLFGVFCLVSVLQQVVYLLCIGVSYVLMVIELILGLLCN